jgi:gliding motility-associated-like protein
VIAVANPLSGYGYRLYATETSTDTLEQDASGLFTVTASQPGSFYVSQYIGDCESARVQVNITIALADLVVPNTFTPNGDGVNDFWVIKGIATYPSALVQIFTRYGQKVFESRGYSQPFDGNYNNAKLPPGVYYYIINLNSNCNLQAGSLTLIR